MVKNLIVLSNANARLLGSHQVDALQNITGSFYARRSGPHRTVSNEEGAFFMTNEEDPAMIGSTPGTSYGGVQTGFDASRVVRTSSETRSSNTALAPRIIAF